MAEPYVQDFFRSGIPGVELYCEMIIQNGSLRQRPESVVDQVRVFLPHVTACIRSNLRTHINVKSLERD